MFEILSSAEMKQAEAAAIASGVPGIQLMNAAGAAVAAAILKEFQHCPVLVLCGPGNNGGDGFIVAQLLKKSGWPVRVACVVKRAGLKNDAALAAQKWDGEIEGLNSNLSVHQTGLILDAVFGTGFDRPLDSEILILFKKIAARKIPVVAVDVPTGLNATTGAVDPGALKAHMTVTFCRKKTGHILFPGRSFCGKLSVADIGIPNAVITSLQTSCFENNSALWLKDFPVPDHASHKYTRGHAVVYGGEKRTGAACLAAASAQKIGAGLVTLTSPRSRLNVYAGYRASLLVDECDTVEEFKTILRDERKNVFLIGPGAGAPESVRAMVDAALIFKKSGVLDADVFSAYASNPADLFARLSPRHILTPHEGEFGRLFGALDGSKTERALKAAKISNAIILLKGADTVIAAPDGSCVVNTNAPPTLATAGSGDVLAGFITGLVAQGMPPFQASCAAVWLHGQAAQNIGFCLTAEDIINQVSQELKSILTPLSDDP